MSRHIANVENYWLYNVKEIQKFFDEFFYN